MQHNIRCLFGAFGLVMVTCAAGCPAPCATSNECRQNEATSECVVVEEGSACQTVDADRVATACDVVEDCAGFPIEAECLNGACRCPDQPCDGAWSAARCLCFASDGEFDAVCFDDDDCRNEMTCVSNRCTDAPQIGAACRENADCSGGPELFTCILETCRQLPDDNGVCDDNGDCRIRPTDRCVNGQCHTNSGQPGERCFGNSDCYTEVCGPDFFCE